MALSVSVCMHDWMFAGRPLGSDLPLYWAVKRRVLKSTRSGNASRKHAVASAMQKVPAACYACIGGFSPLGPVRTLSSADLRVLSRASRNESSEG